MAKYVATNRDGDQSLTVFGTDWQKPVAGTHPNYTTLLNYLATTPESEHDEEYIKGLVDPTVGIGRILQEHFGDRVTFDLHRVYVDGLPMAGALASEVRRRMLAADQDWLRFTKFLVRLEENPSKRAKDAVWGWVEKHGVSITEDGRMVGYKGLVRGQDAVTGEPDVPVSHHAGPNNFIDGVYYGEPETSYHVPHRLGSVISKRRADVDDNSRLACSTGLHVGAYSYAKTFGENREDGYRYSTMGKMASTFALVAFAPEDVVSVPEDNSSDWKIRVSKYEVIEFLNEVQDVLKDTTSYTAPAKVDVPVEQAAPFIPRSEQDQQEEQPPVAKYVAPPAQDEKSEERLAREEELSGLSEGQRDRYDYLRMNGHDHRESLLDAKVYVTEEAAGLEAAEGDPGQPSPDLTLAENADLVEDLKRDLHDGSIGHKPLARKWAHLTTESSVRRYRKANGIQVSTWTKVKDQVKDALS